MKLVDFVVANVLKTILTVCKNHFIGHLSREKIRKILVGLEGWAA